MGEVCLVQDQQLTGKPLPGKGELKLLFYPAVQRNWIARIRRQLFVPHLMEESLLPVSHHFP